MHQQVVILPVSSIIPTVSIDIIQLINFYIVVSELVINDGKNLTILIIYRTIQFTLSLFVLNTM